ncbi:MAG: hypothetical protein IKA31_04780, partial [Clostridia bacterium]|nr:hypothetical protein [Clostridia bacterium]
LVDAKGIPNVYNHNISVTNVTYKTDFLLEKDFILTFVYKSDLINAIPVSTPEEFLEMKEGFDYRLTNDIILSDYTPISTAISSFDGNNYNIYITSFSYTSEDKGECVLGLFNEVNKNTMLYNVSVVYTNKVELVKGENVPDVIGLNSNLTNASVVKFGGIAGRNNGTLTNCTVSGKVNLTLNIDVNAGTIAEALNGGLVAINSETGYITNSIVKNFNFNGYGVTGGFVGENSGKIVSSYFDSSSINNLSSNDTAGFVYLNSGYIYESYVQGYRLSTDVDIRNTGAGVVSKGTIGGFVHTNQKVISDCYANISLSSSIYIAGFIYQDTSESVISRSYSISYKSASDNSTVASPFAGANSANYTKVTINGVLNNCYYLNIAGWSKLTWDSDLPTKQAGGLTLDEFATHTNFVNYDLSLEYKQGYYADSTTLYDYADGYIWVIIEGKPVIVSTLIDTISQCDYKGKTKDYSSTFAYYDAAKYTKIEVVEVAVGTDKVRVSYYDNSKDVPVDELTEDELIFYTMQDNTKLTINYYFMPKGDNEAITLTYKITELENGKIKTKEILSAEYGNNEKKILDTRDKNESGYIEDKNFRANDTIEISYDENGLVNYINYKVLESASYYYASNALNVSHVVGSRTNPQIIYDYKSFVYYTSQNNAGKFFRVIRDIDFGYQFTPTAYKTFQGAIQGNYMEFDNISISFLNNSQENEDDKHVNVTSFGLFATISTINTFVVSDDFDTIISNLKLNIIEVLSNTHKFVGGLAGQITADQTLSNRNVVLSNITIGGIEGDAAYIQGKNAVGGLAGIATGNVIIKDITCSVNVNASKEINNGDASKLLYDKNNANPVDNVAYAGAVIGIFDTNIIDDPSTERDYNANNITVNGEISIIGGIVGSAFGMVGKTTVVNYVNTVIKNSNKNYLRATAYAGGLVGENRGQIISSSIGYGELETYSSAGIGTSSLISTNYFYNGYSSNSVIAIGGLVGLNNGGTISNSISSVDVRNKNATIAGGAVGRMIQGSLINVISSGSVLSKSIVGGFIGVLNDYNMILSAGYKSNSIVRVEDEINPTVITNCVSATNWMVKDYTYFMGLINAGYPVAGFIGLISYSSSTGNINFIKFEGSNYFTNTLYTSTNSNVPQYYLKVAFKSESFDLVTNFDEAYIESLNGIDGKQAVHPYSIREMYYE